MLKFWTAHKRQLGSKCRVAWRFCDAWRNKAADLRLNSVGFLQRLNYSKLRNSNLLVLYWLSSGQIIWVRCLLAERDVFRTCRKFMTKILVSRMWHLEFPGKRRCARGNCYYSSIKQEIWRNLCEKPQPSSIWHHLDIMTWHHDMTRIEPAWRILNLFLELQSNFIQDATSEWIK